MRQDRRLNGWILIAAIIGAIAGLTLLVAGGFLGVAGFIWEEKLLEITDLQFFVWQEGIVEAQLKLFNNELLKSEILYLILGGIAAFVGLITLILSIVCLNYAKKRKVVRHRVALLIFALLSLGIAGCVGTYLWLEFKTLTDNIKYVAYGVGGVFAFVGLCQVLGVIFGRSEKFMSNDNSKYAFSNSSVKNARADINNNSNAPIPQQEYVPVNQENYMTQDQQRLMSQQINSRQGVNSSIPQGGQARPIQVNNPAQPMRQPMGQVPPRPASAMPQRPQARPTQPMGPRSAQPMQGQRPVQPAGSRPMQPNMQRPMQQPPRPMGTQNRPAQANAQAKAFCKKCGKLLAPGEKICTLCGYKVAE